MEETHIQLVIELAIVKSMTEQILKLVQESTDEALKNKVRLLLGTLEATRQVPVEERPVRSV